VAIQYFSGFTLSGHEGLGRILRLHFVRKDGLCKDLPKKWEYKVEGEGYSYLEMEFLETKAKFVGQIRCEFLRITNEGDLGEYHRYLFLKDHLKQIRETSLFSKPS
jgi:hypothetical protein